MTKQLCRLVDTLRRILIPPSSLNRLESSRVSLSGRESAGSKGGSSNFDLLSFLPSKLPPSPARNPSGPLRWILRQTTKPHPLFCSLPTQPSQLPRNQQQLHILSSLLHRLLPPSTLLLLFLPSKPSLLYPLHHHLSISTGPSTNLDSYATSTPSRIKLPRFVIF